MSLTGKHRIVTMAETEVLVCANVWLDEIERVTDRPLTDTERRLKLAVTLLRRTRHITSTVRVDEVQRLLEEQKAEKKK